MNQLAKQTVSAVIFLAIAVGLATVSTQLSTRLPVAANSTQTKNSSATTTPISYNGEEGKTVLELLKRNHKVETRSSSFGTFVSSIDGIGQTENSAWLYYVNGQIGEVASDQAITKAEQVIEWRYETF